MSFFARCGSKLLCDCAYHLVGVAWYDRALREQLGNVWRWVYEEREAPKGLPT